MKSAFLDFCELIGKREITKFLIVGLINTALAYGVYVLLVAFLAYKIAYCIAYIAGFLCSYFLNTKWVFRSEVSWKSFFSFPLVYAAQFLINLVSLHLLVEEFLIPVKIAFLPVIVLSIPITFLMSRYIIKSPAGRPGLPEGFFRKR